MRTTLSILAGVWLATLAGCSAGRGNDDPTPPPKPGPTGAVEGCPSFVEASKGLPAEGEWKSIPSTGDVNGDGLADIAVLGRKEHGPRVFLSDGVGGWTDDSKDLQYPSDISCGIGTRLRDIDGDGHVDLLVADHCQGVFVFRGDGAGHFEPASAGIPRNLQGVNDADVGDVDGDGTMDIVALSAFSGGFLVLKGHPDRSWTILPNTGLASSGLGFNLRLVDVNGDGLLDVLASFGPSAAERRDMPPPPAKVWLNGPAGQFRPATGFSNKGRFFGMTTWKRPDRPVCDLITALSGAYGGIYRFESDTGEKWTDLGRIDRAGFREQGADFVGIEAVDIDKDGCADLVTSEGMTGKVWLAMGDCKGGWRFCPETTLPMEKPLATWGVATGDFNGDGRVDVVAAFGRGSVGAVKVWYQSGAAKK